MINFSAQLSLRSQQIGLAKADRCRMTSEISGKRLLQKLVGTVKLRQGPMSAMTKPTDMD